MPSLLKLLGHLGSNLPQLSRAEWDAIFEFFEYFSVIQGEDPKNIPGLDWKKVQEILSLLGRITD
jgi:hypothetical protein